MSKGLLHLQKPSFAKASHQPTIQPPMLSTEDLTDFATGEPDTEGMLKAGLEALGFSAKKSVQRVPSPSVKQRRKEPLVRLSAQPKRKPSRRFQASSYVLK